MENKRRGLKEPFSGLSHLAGALLSVAGLITLLIMAQGRPRYLIAFAIYGLSLVVLYSMSALYHSLHVAPSQEKWLQRFDYIAIFLLIAGTYTPICLITLDGAWRWGLLGGVWSLAALGICAILFWRGHPHWIRVALYILMGWLAVAALPPLRAALPAAGIGWLIAGGLTYTIGVIFYASQRPRLWPGVFGSHDLWHVFVLGGSVCHFIMIVRYIAPTV